MIFNESNDVNKNIFATAEAEGNCVSYSLMDRWASFQTQSFRGFRLFRGWLDGLNMFEPFEWQDGVFPWPWTFPGKVEVGIGSGALHASLDAVAQAGDELPMLQLGDPVPSRPTL